MTGSKRPATAQPRPLRLTLPAPAKLNLFLHVTGRRDDGYHTLESVFVPIAYGDTIALLCRDDGVVVRTGAVEGIPEAHDLGVRAARLLQQRAHVDRGVALTVTKRTPVGGGLGGGSSDAATVLMGLNVLWDLHLTRSDLMRVGLELGADVPFFIFGRAAFARGVGEQLSAVSVPPMWALVLVPPVSVSTAAIFSAPELTRNSVSAKMLVFPEGCGRNDLQAAAIARFPEIAQYASTLGVEGVARITGPAHVFSPSIRPSSWRVVRTRLCPRESLHSSLERWDVIRCGI